jgi:ribulose-phosphate 3-epimerase
MEILPSILSADFARLGEQVGEVMEAGATVIHVDVMDGHFVPPITMGPIVVSALREALPAAAHLDVHLMIDRPERQVGEFARAGADTITFHVEATPHLDYTVNAIREAGAKAGVAVCPGTPPEVLAELDCDLRLVMTVNPGWGGQPFIPRQLDKVRRVRSMAPDLVEVDGGVNARTAASCVEAGADWLVAGSAVFGAADPAQAFRDIVSSAQSSAVPPR